MPCRPSVCLLLDVRGRSAASPLTSTSQWKGQGAPAVESEAEQQVQERRTAVVSGRWVDTKLRLNNRARPDVRRTAVAIAAGRLSLCACRARQLTTCDTARSRRTAEAIETGQLATSTNFSGVFHRAETECRSGEGVTVIRLTHWD